MFHFPLLGYPFEFSELLPKVCQLLLGFLVFQSLSLLDVFFCLEKLLDRYEQNHYITVVLYFYFPVPQYNP